MKEFDTKLEVVKTWYLDNLGIDLSSLPSWGIIDELRLVANSVKHAEGKSAMQLRELRPELFSNPDLAEILAEWERYGRRQEPGPLLAPLAGEDLFVSENHLKAYADGARSLFEEIIELCESHSDDRFPCRALFGACPNSLPRQRRHSRR